MNEALRLMLALASGVCSARCSLAAFGGRFRKGFRPNSPALWFFGSLLLRMSIALAGFYFIARGHWERLLVCLVGFIMARSVVIWLTRSSAENQTRPAQEASHAH